MKKPIAPCHNCPDRVIDNGKQCESSCVKMAEFKRLNEDYKNAIYDAKVALRVAQKAIQENEMNITLTKCNDGLYKVLINDQLLGNGLTFNEAVTLIEEETEEIKI